MVNYEDKFAWYIVTAKMGKEEEICEIIKSYGSQLPIEDAIIPYETTLEVKKEKVVEHKVKLYPSCIFVKAKMTVPVWSTIKRTKDVFGFLGTKGKGANLPMPVDDQEMLTVINASEHKDYSDVTNINVGDSVIIVSGPFANVKGTVTNFKTSSTAEVSVTMFGDIRTVEIETINLLKTGEKE